ncbi:MAG: hypothetical protein JWM14_1447, partial [Chitinophagaceae bacterium]|nr:hypothetical protein [Chitinophagaceae bacterium]
DSLTQIYAETPCMIYYVGNEIVKLKQGNYTFVDIPYLEIKNQELKDGPLTSFYVMLGYCLLVLLVTLAIPEFAKWTKRKTGQLILKIPYTKEIGDGLFEYKYMGNEALIHLEVYFNFSKTGNKNMITVYFPRPENLVQPVKMGIDSFQGEKYYNFTHRIIFLLNYKKLQQKIESKFV